MRFKTTSYGGTLVKTLILALSLFTSIAQAYSIKKTYPLKWVDCLGVMRMEDSGKRLICDVSFHEPISKDFALTGGNSITFAPPYGEGQILGSIRPQPQGYRLELTAEQALDIRALTPLLTYFIDEEFKEFEALYYTIGNGDGKLRPMSSVDSFEIRIEDCLENMIVAKNEKSWSCQVKFDRITETKGMKSMAKASYDQFQLKNGQIVYMAIKPEVDGYEIKLKTFGEKLELSELIPWLQFKLLFHKDISAQIQPTLIKRCTQLLTGLFKAT